MLVQATRNGQIVGYFNKRAGKASDVLCVLIGYVLGFIFRNQGPLQKVCCDTDTHASPQLWPRHGNCYCHASQHQYRAPVTRLLQL